MGRELFGTDGIRGVPGSFPLDDSTVYAAGVALGRYAVETAPAGSRRILIGMDTRESGPRLARQLAAGLRHAGSEPVSAGVITTPGVAALVRANDFVAGVVISASHNPFRDNGIKLFSHAGMKFPDEVEEKLEADILRHRESISAAAAEVDLPLVRELQWAEQYLSILRSRAQDAASFKNLKIVLDCANGAASELGPSLFRSVGACVIAIHAAPDGKNINDGCGSLHPEAMRQRVVAEKADLGVAFDGDADRAIFSTASGRLVDGDGVLYLSARALKASDRLHGGKIVGTTMTNLGLERALAREGVGLVRVPVGDRYVLEEMLRSGANLGGEPSGHVIFLDDGPAGDGLGTAIRVAAAVSGGKTLDALTENLFLFPQRIQNVPVSRKPPLESLAEVTQLVEQARTDLGEASRIVLRYSGTENVARVMVEGENEGRVEHWTAAIAAAIGRNLANGPA